MTFIQIIEFRTDDYERMRALDEEYEQATEGRSTVQRSIVTRDRNDPELYRVIVFFDSYEAAKENDALPETQAMGAKMQAFASAPTFHDLDVLEDRS